MDTIGLGVLHKFYLTELHRSNEGLINSAINQVKGKIKINGGILNDNELNKVVAILYKIEQRLKAANKAYKKIKMSLDKSDKTKSMNKKNFFALWLKHDEERQLKLISDHVNKMKDLKLANHELEILLSSLKEEERNKIINQLGLDEQFKSDLQSIIQLSDNLSGRYAEYLDMLYNSLHELSSVYEEVINIANDQILEIENIIDELSSQDGMEEVIEAYRSYQRALEYIIKNTRDVGSKVSSAKNAVKAQYEYYSKDHVDGATVNTVSPIKIGQLVKIAKSTGISLKYLDKLKKSIIDDNKSSMSYYKNIEVSDCKISADAKAELIRMLKAEASQITSFADQYANNTSEMEVKYNKNDDPGIRLK